ncbi:MAG: hypothetical protein IKX76_05770, partial [Eubacterium sp.]|nr:hypothetical protein [Eubacterium sp.]
VSAYLGELYGSHTWYAILLCLSNILTTVLGLIYISHFFPGDLPKNLLLFFAVEILYSLVTMINMQLGEQAIFGKNSQALLLSKDAPPPLYLVLLVNLLAIAVLYYCGRGLLKNYKGWEPRHPGLLYVLIVFYLLLGLLSNIYMALASSFTVIALQIFAVAFLIILMYFWYDVLRIIRLREMTRHRELVVQEQSMKLYYENTLHQSALIDQYSREIRDMMEKLMKKVSGQDQMRSSIQGYLDVLQEQYDTLSVSRYCDDYLLDQYLNQSGQMIREAGYEPVILFQEYRTPEGVLVEDVMGYINWMLSPVYMRKLESVPQISSVSPKATDALPDKIFLQGGIGGKTLILSCRIEDGQLKAPSMSKIRRLKKRTRADVDITRETDKLNIVVGIPA